MHLKFYWTIYASRLIKSRVGAMESIISKTAINRIYRNSFVVKRASQKCSPVAFLPGLRRNARLLHYPYALDLGNYLQSLWTRPGGVLVEREDEGLAEVLTLYIIPTLWT
ncbi:18531_t:CDS:1 [Funneliformis geosporum]|uniref:2646_t:CDS:1 n=1 Tax=Funneliformis geosporum TaxID=1117311 RepID=A0A9W4T047_9GLOM|nr:2646_t:CDS:1 [Funneliformis geosporum]CAI2191990.1 18531_t:CDS:1 [Funneliformis geosporum]